MLLLAFSSVTEPTTAIALERPNRLLGILCEDWDIAFDALYDVKEGKELTGNCDYYYFPQGLHAAVSMTAPYTAFMYDLGDAVAIYMP